MDLPQVSAPTVLEAGGSLAEKEVLGWLEFGEAARYLAADIVQSEFAPDYVIAIARGGLLLAGALAYALGVKNCGSLNVEFYTGVNERLPMPVIIPPLLDQQSLAGQRILLVDDVADSGRTLALVADILKDVGVEVRSVVLYTKPGSMYRPDYVWRNTARWILFPWSALPPVTIDTV